MEKASIRKAYGEALARMGEINGDIVVLDADLGKSTMSYIFEQKFPDRFFEMGIAEQNMTATAAGLSLVGKIPFINSFSIFVTGRNLDQIRQSICLPRLNVKICGSSCGFSDFGDGSTHQALEDVALMRVLPNMTVLVPVDANQAVKMVEALVHYKGPAYLRINRSDLPVLTGKDEGFEIGKTYVMREGGDFVVFANGIMVAEALKAADMLKHDGISVCVVNVPTVKPLKPDEIRLHTYGKMGAVAAEEHNAIGGLCSAVAEALAYEGGIPLRTVAVNDSFGTSAEDYETLLKAYGLTAESIVAAVKDFGIDMRKEHKVLWED